MRLVTFIVFLGISSISLGQDQSQKRIAIPNNSKDTLYVINSMASTYRILWQTIESNSKPVIIPVKTLPDHLIHQPLISTKKD